MKSTQGTVNSRVNLVTFCNLLITYTYNYMNYLPQ